AAPQPVPLPRLIIAATNLFGGNGNGVIDYDECNSMDIILTNIGSLNASGVQATLSSTTPGVLIALSTVNYPDIATNAAGTNQLSFKVSTTPFFICGTPVDFALVVKSDQVTSTNFFRLNSGTPGAPTRFDQNAVVLIPDNDLAGVSS